MPHDASGRLLALGLQPHELHQLLQAAFVGDQSDTVDLQHDVERLSRRSVHQHDARSDATGRQGHCREEHDRAPDREVD